MTGYIKRCTGVHPNTKCSVCKITAAESYKLGPVDTGINHPEYCSTYWFYQTLDTKQYQCPRCHRELSIKKLFDAMDARESKQHLQEKKP